MIRMITIIGILIFSSIANAKTYCSVSRSGAFSACINAKNMKDYKNKLQKLRGGSAGRLVSNVTMYDRSHRNKFNSRSRKEHNVKRYSHARNVNRERFQTEKEQSIDGSSVRPHDCYGIPWCGCWLRHQFGLTSKALNVAINWLNVGTPSSPENANVVVWRHHVAKLLQYAGNRILIISGNDGNRVRTRWVSTGSLGGVRGYRRV